MSATSSFPWPRFSLDPRQPENADLRASDRDRDVVLEVLAEAYADGRIDQQEHEARTEATTAAKKLGDLPVILADLVPVSPGASPGDLALASPEDLHARAAREYQAARRRAVSGLVIPSVITFVIWFAVGFDDDGWHFAFPWPLFVVLGTGINLLRVLLNKQDIIEEEQRRLERKQRKALGKPRRPDQQG